MRIAAAATALSLIFVTPALADDPPPKVQADMRWALYMIAATSHWSACPTTQTRNGPPFFSFNGKMSPQFVCFMSKPFQDSNLPPGGPWYVQLVGGLTPVDASGNIDLKACNVGTGQPCMDSVIRLCAQSMISSRKVTSWRAGPCASKVGVGQGGCEVCAAAEN
jgi:hypothetical protein